MFKHRLAAQSGVSSRRVTWRLCADTIIRDPRPLGDNPIHMHNRTCWDWRYILSHDINWPTSNITSDHRLYFLKGLEWVEFDHNHHTVKNSRPLIRRQSSEHSEPLGARYYWIYVLHFILVPLINELIKVLVWSVVLLCSRRIVFTLKRSFFLYCRYSRGLVDIILFRYENPDMKKIHENPGFNPL